MADAEMGEFTLSNRHGNQIVSSVTFESTTSCLLKEGDGNQNVTDKNNFKSGLICMERSANFVLMMTSVIFLRKNRLAMRHRLYFDFCQTTLVMRTKVTYPWLFIELKIAQFLPKIQGP